jgi:hypothetical protein
MNRRVMIILAALLTLGFSAGAATADQTYMSVTFDDKAIDQPLGQGGTSMGEASYCDPEMDAIVRAAPFATPSLELHNTDPVNNRNIYFYLPSSSVSSGLAVIVMDLWFYQTGEGWAPYLEFYTFGWVAQLKISLLTDGSIQIRDSELAATVPSCPTGRALPLLVAMDLDSDTYSVWIDQVQWVTDRPLSVPGGDFDKIQISSGYGCTPESHFSIDQIRVIDWLPPVPTVRTTWGTVRALFRD